MFNKEYLDYSDVLIIPNRTSITSRKEVEIKRHFTGPVSNYTFRANPIIVSNLDTTGTQDMAKALEPYQITVALHKFHTNSQLRWPKSPYEWVTIGMRDQDWKSKIQHANIAGNYLICIDVANGYMDSFVTFIKQVREAFPQHYIMAGNICTPDIVKAYYKAGADCVKVGIGSGKLCRTRVTAGIGMPQFTAVQDVAKEAKKYKMQVCADGGITEYADFAKALVAGADFVMAGSIFNGHDESGDEFYNNEKQFKVAYGMSSKTAMDKHYGGQETHRASEGRTVLVPYKGPISHTISEINGSIRSTMTYTNSKTPEDLKKARWIKVNNTINTHFQQNTIAH